MSELVHATAISVAGQAALIRGPSGAGKSDLALRCLAVTRPPFVNEPPMLVADDQVVVVRDGATLRIAPPAAIAGLIEVRGLGVLALPYAASARLVLVADLCAPAAVERLPDPAQDTELYGVRIAAVRLAPFEASAPLKLLLALAAAGGGQVQGVGQEGVRQGL